MRIATKMKRRNHCRSRRRSTSYHSGHQRWETLLPHTPTQLRLARSLARTTRTRNETDFLVGPQPFGSAEPIISPKPPIPQKAGHLLVNLGFWNFRFSDFRLSRFSFWKIFLKNMLVRYRGINNKGVLERPWTKSRVWDAISTTLKCQFTGKCWKVDFLTPCTTKSAETLVVAPYARCGPPGNP